MQMAGFFYALYHVFLCWLNGVFVIVLSIFVVLQVKESVLLVGACGSLSGLVMRETR